MASTIGQVKSISVDVILPNPDQPRRTFAMQSLQEMADSVTQDGVRQPIALAEIKDSEKIAYYQQRFKQLQVENPSEFFDRSLKYLASSPKVVYVIIYGERRWRGSIIAGKAEVPAVIHKGMTDAEIATIALLENMQRENVGFLEEARAIEVWMKNQGLDPTAQIDRRKAAKRLGKSITFVDWRLDCLFLQPHIQEAVDRGELNANEVAHLAWCKKPESQAKLYKLIATGKCKTHAQLEAATKALNEGAEKQYEQQTLGLQIADKTKAIALTKEVEAICQRMTKIKSGDDETNAALDQMDLGELQHLATLFAALEKMVRAIHKDKIVYREQAFLAAGMDIPPVIMGEGAASLSDLEAVGF